MNIPKKVYDVKFGIVSKDDDYTNFDNRRVLASTALEAAKEADKLLSKKERKSYYVSEVELVAYDIENI